MSLPDISDQLGHSLGYSGYSPLNTIGYSLKTGERVYALAPGKEKVNIMVTPDE